MKSAIGILTYRRVASLSLFLESVIRECPGVPIAVFEDCGQTDETEAYLLKNAKFVRRDMEFEADIYDREGVLVYLAHSNVGVTGNSNKAIRWFMELEGDYDHLCLCNDDLEVMGPFHQIYATAHTKLEIGLFCHCDFTSDAYKWANVKIRGVNIKLLSRMTGIMMSITRKLIEKIGYYDADAFTFGQEHCDYTNRARLTGFINLNNQPQYCLDVENPFLRHQEVESSLTTQEKHNYNATADIMIEEAAKTYSTMSLHRSYSTGRWCNTVAGRDGIGTPLNMFRNIFRIKDSQLDGTRPLVPVHEQPESVDLGVDNVSAPRDVLG